MLSFIIPVVLILFLAALWILGTWAADECHPVAFIAAVILGICATFGTIGFTLNACDYGDYLINPEIRIEATEEKRDSLIQLLSSYNLMMENDVNASDAYMTIHQDVLEFNDAVRRADKWQGNWWVEGWLYDPTYVGVSVIPIN